MLVFSKYTCVWSFLWSRMCCVCRKQQYYFDVDSRFKPSTVWGGLYKIELITYKYSLRVSYLTPSSMNKLLSQNLWILLILVCQWSSSMIFILNCLWSVLIVFIINSISIKSFIQYYTIQPLYSLSLWI